jgi:hypothetical protein
MNIILNFSNNLTGGDRQSSISVLEECIKITGHILGDGCLKNELLNIVKKRTWKMI